MKKLLFFCSILIFVAFAVNGQKTPTGNPADFKVKTCLHSIGYSGLWRGQAFLTVDEFLVKAKELGYDGVMLMAKRPHLSLVDYDKEVRAKLKKRIEDLGLTLVGLAGYSDFTAGIDKPGIPYDKQYAIVVEGITLAAKEAQKYGVTLVVQNHHDIALHHDAMYWMLKEINMPNVMAGWDAWSPNLEGLSKEEVRKSVLKMKPYIVNTIVADYVSMPRYHYENYLTNYVADKPVMRATAMGEGIIDYQTFIGALKEIGYQGHIVYEMCEVLEGGGSIANLDKTAKKFIDYMKRFDK